MLKTAFGYEDGGDDDGYDDEYYNLLSSLVYSLFSNFRYAYYHQLYTVMGTSVLTSMYVVKCQS